MKRKIIFIIPKFEIGGTLTCLKSMCANIDNNKYEIQIFAISHCGGLKNNFIQCNVIKENLILSACVAGFYEEKRYFRKFVILLIRLFAIIFSFFRVDFYDILLKKISFQYDWNKYDTIISFQEGFTTKFAKYIKSKNKIAWIHCDYFRYLNLFDLAPENDYYEQYDKIVCVSQYTKEIFCKLLPDYSYKTLAIHNVIDEKNIIKLSKNIELDASFMNDCFTIISVGRLDPVKRFEMIPMLLSNIKKMTNKKIRWYIIGGGAINYEIEMQSLIELYGVNNEVICLGMKSNPYKYIVRSNLLVSTSISEACPNVINEAKVLHVPVVCSNYDTAIEMIDSGNNGIICPIEKMAEMISELINNEEFYFSLKNNLKAYRYNNIECLNEIYKII